MWIVEGVVLGSIVSGMILLAISISHTFKSRPWANRVVAIANNAKAFDLLFAVNRLVRMKLLPGRLIMNGQITCMKVEKVTWLDSLNYLVMPLRTLPEACGLTAQKSRFPHLSNTTENMSYVGPAAEFSYYGIDQMHESKRKEYLAWYGLSRRWMCSTTGYARTLLLGRCNGAVGGVSHVSQTLPTNRKRGSVSREHDDRIGL